MVPCEPGLQVVFEDGRVLPWWSTHERTAEEIRRISAHDADAFGRVTERLHELARSLQPFFLEEPPNLYARGWSKVREGRRLFRRFRHLSGDQLSDLVRFARARSGVRRTAFRVRRGATALPREQRLRHARAAVPAGDGDRPALPHALGRRAPHPGIQRTRDRGMGAITQAMAAAVRDAGAEIRTSATVARIDVRDGARPGSRSRTGPRSPLGSSCRTPTRSGRSSGWSRSPTCPWTSAPTWRRSRWPGRARR